MPEFYSPDNHIERNPNSQDWSETTGFQTTIELTGPLPVLEERRDDALRCGYTEASLSQSSPGSALWVLRLSYVGRNPPESLLFQPEPEEQSTHWTFRPNYENLDLWRHPTYAPLIECEIEVGRRTFKQVDDDLNELASLGIIRVNADGTVLPVDEADITENIRNRIGAYDENGQWVWLEASPALIFESENSSFVGPPSPDSMPPRSIITDLRFPYSGLIQTAALAWRRALESRIQSNLDNIMRNLPSIAEERIKLQTTNVESFVNLTKKFDIREHLATRIIGGGYHAYSLIPKRTFSDPKGETWTQERLISLAQNFADEILARRDRYPYDRQTIMNERVVSVRSGMNANYVGVNEIWVSSQIARVIQHQIEQREALLDDRPGECQDRHATMEEMIRILENQLFERVWLKRAPRTRITGRGRLEITQEWEERLPWEINERINPYYTGPVYIGDPLTTPQVPPGGDGDGGIIA